MGLWDRVTQFLALEPWVEPEVQTRSTPDSYLADFVARIQGTRSQVWRTASTQEALGVPAIFSAVSLIANATGSLSLKAFQKGRELPDDDRPRIIIRPNPFSTPRDFFRDTAYSMAVYGEAWWWVAARDFDDLPLSLIPVNPLEIKVTEDPDDLRFPIIEWRGKKMPNADMKQITYLRDPGALRGFGPLQKCGAAVSVAVESQEWAANFYADGGKGGTTIKAAYGLGTEEDPDGSTEADRLRAQWVARAHNTVRVIDTNIESIDEHEPNEASAQMLKTREANDVDAAQMFNIPAPMIEAAVSGSSLTYQNIPSLYDSFARRCLTPNYLEPIEQTMSDLLTRSTVARFNVDALLRVDLKTRWEVYEISTKVIGGEDAAALARQKEGIEPGDVEFAPVPLSVPAAIPASLPIQGRSLATENDGRCPHCRKKIARTLGPGTDLDCPRCKAHISIPAIVEAREADGQAPTINVHMPPQPALPAPTIMPAPEIRIEPQFIVPPSPPPNITVEAAPQMGEFHQKVDRLATLVADLAEKQLVGQSTLDAITAAQAQLADKITAARKPRAWIPERDEDGRIVKVTEAA